MKKTIYSLLISAFILTIGVNTSSAATYDFFSGIQPNGNNPAHGFQNAGILEYAKSRYNSNAQILSWEFALSPSVGHFPNFFWVVLTEGGIPRAGSTEYAILYGDMVSKQVTAYVYHAHKLASAIDPTAFIHAYQNAITVQPYQTTGEVYSFLIDTSFINNVVPGFSGVTAADWKGAGYNESIGIWSHWQNLETIAYDSEGRIVPNSWVSATGDDYGYGYYDRSFTTAQVVPEPATMALLGSSLLGMVGARRKKKA